VWAEWPEAEIVRKEGFSDVGFLFHGGLKVPARFVAVVVELLEIILSAPVAAVVF
jgi:hypothetical protein